MTPLVLEVDALDVEFDVGGTQLRAVRGISFTLTAGQRLGVVGESGCGKSTAALALMGLLPPNATAGGRVLLERGRHPRGRRHVDAATSVERHRDGVPGGDECVQPGSPRRRADSRTLVLHRNKTRRQADKRAGELLEMVGIAADRAARYPHEFSGGMRQRAALAMALACEPKILLADEPTTSLDVIVQLEVLALLRRITEELGVAMVFISHDLPAIAQVADRIAVMYAGRIVEEAPTDRLLTAPQHPYTAALLAAIPDPYSDTPGPLGDGHRR